MNNTLETFTNGKRKAIIKETGHGIAVFFYYDGDPDYEWKRGSHGTYCDTCKTLAQAKGKAKRYTEKE